MFYEESHIYDGSDVDAMGYCKLSSLLTGLQHAAMYAAETTGFGHTALLERYGAVWMLARTWVKLKKPIRYGDDVTIRTWYRKGKGALLYRDYDLIIDDELVGEAVSGWVLVHLESRKILRLNDITELIGTDGGSLSKSYTIQRDRVSEDMELVEKRKMRYSDMDMNGHVNNTRYADFIADAIYQENRPNQQFCTEFQIHYVKECRAGEELALYQIDVEGGHCVRGVDEDGKTRFEAKIIFGEDIY